MSSYLEKCFQTAQIFDLSMVTVVAFPFLIGFKVG